MLYNFLAFLHYRKMRYANDHAQMAHTDITAANSAHTFAVRDEMNHTRNENKITVFSKAYFHRIP